MPTIRAGRYGFALRIQTIKKAADEAPLITANLVSSEPVEVATGRHALPLRLVIVKDGRVVAGQDAPIHPHPAWMPGNDYITPTRPFVAPLRPASPRPCGSLSWSSLWAHPDGYSIWVLADASAFTRIDKIAANSAEQALGVGFAPGQYLLDEQPFPTTG